MNSFLRLLKNKSGRGDYLSPEDTFLDSRNNPGFDAYQLEGTLEKPLSRYITYLFIAVIIAVFFLFVGKLYVMQVILGDSFKERAEKNAMKSIPVFPLRGTIEDRNGVPLAWNEQNDVAEIKERRYIRDHGFSNLVGYVSYPKKDQGGFFWQEEYLGKDGVEKAYQEELQGEKGEQLIEVSATRQIVTQNVTVPPISGKTIRLTIDSKVQSKMYEVIESLAKKANFIAGAGVMMDVHTGEVIALVNYPEYDNNLMTNASSKEENDQIQKDLTSSSHKFLNRPVAGLFIPGSTVKPFMALAALEEKIISPYKSIYSSGQLVVKNKYGGPDTVFKDWKAHGYVDMRQALAVSSDEYFYEVGGGYMDQKGLGIKRIYEYMTKFGFEDLTHINVSGEVQGTVPNEEWKKKKFQEGTWLLGNTYHTSIGQFGYQTTPIELARSYSLIANGSFLPTPTILFNNTTVGVPVHFSPENLKVVQEGMRRGVTDGISHALNISGVSAAAKTGTAEVGAKKEKVNSLIATYFPYENPKYVLVLVMEKAPQGNTFGASIAASEMLTFLRDETNYTK